jgi:hypothetical protein
MLSICLPPVGIIHLVTDLWIPTTARRRRSSLTDLDLVTRQGDGMSKVDAQRAMREARYTAMQAQTSSRPPAVQRAALAI